MYSILHEFLNVPSNYLIIYYYYYYSYNYYTSQIHLYGRVWVTSNYDSVILILDAS